MEFDSSLLIVYELIIMTWLYVLMQLLEVELFWFTAALQAHIQL